MKQIYNMIDDIPIWQHLKNGAIENKLRLTGTDYGKFAEIIGKRILNKLTKKGGILTDIFPGIEIISVHRFPRLRILNNAKIEMGDFALEIDYKDSGSFGKKIVIFEIKHGHFQIEQNQLRRYCFMIKNPGEYFSKANEVKVIFMMFDKIDTVGCSALYLTSELDKGLADKVLDSNPQKAEDEIVKCNVNIKDSCEIDLSISEGLKVIMD